MQYFISINTIDSLLTAASNYIDAIIPDICHASLWGNDTNQKCIFLSHELKGELGIKDFPSFSVIHYSDGIFGPAAKQQIDVIISEESLCNIQSPSVRDYLKKKGVRTIGLICLNTVSDYKFYLVLVSRATIKSHLEQSLPLIKLTFSTFINIYSHIRSKASEMQIKKIFQSKLTRSGLDFLKEACEGTAKTFSASTFSVWMIEGDEVVPKYFSDHHIGNNYKLGQGLTGFVAKSGEPVFLHIISDADCFYETAKWEGFVSDFVSRKPDPKDHMMVIPLKYPKFAGGVPTTNGVIRFVGDKLNPSFWPIDFSRACEIADALSVLLYQESLLLAQEQTTAIHTTLISLMQQTASIRTLDNKFLVFLDEIQQWPGVKNITIIEQDELGIFHFEGCSFLASHHLDQLNRLDILNHPKVLNLLDGIMLYPIFTSKQLEAFLIAQFDPLQSTQISNWFKILALILGYLQSIEKLLIETENLRNDNEERQVQSFTGAVYRLWAHEALNGLKAIESWISAAKRRSPDYDRLTERINEIQNNVVELLDSTSFTRLKQKECVFNIELENNLIKLGYKHLRKIANCEIHLSITGHKHKRVHIDPNILIPILNNLVINAREQYSLQRKKGPIEISITEKLIDEKLWIGVSVLDYAVGIPEEKKEWIFLSGKTTKKDGQGLGLWIVKKLVDACNGKVSVDSTFGHYTKFEILFPVIEEG